MKLTELVETLVEVGTEIEAENVDPDVVVVCFVEGRITPFKLSIEQVCNVDGVVVVYSQDAESGVFSNRG